MRPIAGREHKVTMQAVQFAGLSAEEVESRLAHLRQAPDRNAAAITRRALKRVAAVRHYAIPRVPQCRVAACKCREG